MTMAESRRFLDRLESHTLQSQFRYDHPHAVGDVTIWHNWLSIHNVSSEGTTAPPNPPPFIYWHQSTSLTRRVGNLADLFLDPPRELFCFVGNTHDTNTRYSNIDNICGFKASPLKVLSSDQADTRLMFRLSCKGPPCYALPRTDTKEWLDKHTNGYSTPYTA